jgi:hypothetical protein
LVEGPDRFLYQWCGRARKLVGIFSPLD